MERNFRNIAVIVLFMALSARGATQEWLRLTSPNFEMLTTAGDKKGRDAILYFESVRRFFLDSKLIKVASTTPVRIVAFRNEKEYEPYRPNAAAAAYYQAGADHDYIVMSTIAGESYPIAIHEYTHLVLNRSGAKLPIWLNEGLAELFSSLTPQGKKIVVGSLLPGPFQALSREAWIPLSTLIAVDQSSPLYNEKSRAGMFYAESWALTHMLMLTDSYRSKMTELLLAVTAGSSTAEAFQKIWGKSPEDLQKDLNQYLRGGRFMAAVYDVKLDKSSEDAAVEAMPLFDAKLALAEILAASSGQEEAGKRMYLELSKEQPDSPVIAGALARLALRHSNMDEAKMQYARAVELNSKDPKLYFEYAMIRQDHGPEAITLLQKAVDLKPDFQDAHYRLAFLLLGAEKYAAALIQFSQIKNVKAEQAFALFYGTAFAQVRLNAKEQARTSLERAKQYAKSPAELNQVASLTEFLDASNRPRAQLEAAPGEPVFKRTAPVMTGTTTIPAPLTFQAKGTLQQIDCVGKSARFQMISEGKSLAFWIADPTRVVLHNAGAGTVDFTCGPQKPRPVAVEYLPRADEKEKTLGVVREIDFQ